MCSTSETCKVCGARFKALKDSLRCGCSKTGPVLLSTDDLDNIKKNLSTEGQLHQFPRAFWIATHRLLSHIAALEAELHKWRGEASGPY